MRTLITGASGFIGAHVVRTAIAHGHEVYAIGRSRADIQGIQFLECDLHDHASVEQALSDLAPDLLIHLAWYAEPGRFWTAPENLDWVSSSIALARSFLGAGGKRILVAGSCAEYDWSEPCLDENSTPLKPSTLYGRAKASLFELLNAASSELGFELAWGRIFFPFGPGDKPERLIGSLVSAARNRRPAQFSSGRQERDFIHVEDVADALFRLATSDLLGAVNIGTGLPVSVKQFVEEANAQLKWPLELDFGTRELGSGEPQSLYAATQRLRDELGFIPKYTQKTALANTFLKEGIELAAK